MERQLSEFSVSATESPGPPTGSSSIETTRRFRPRTEATRSRDVYRHLQPWIKIFRPTAINRPAFPHDPEQPMPQPEACPDTTLTALTQLCALRLDVRRCLITLVSTDIEYVLCESTRTQSLQYNSVDDSKDALWLGTCSFLRDDGINRHAIEGWRKARRLREPPPDQDFYYTEGISAHWQIFSDLKSTSDYNAKPFVQRGPSARFYCSVPLRGAQGSVLGSVALIDDRPRYGVGAAQMSFIEDLADTIVQHLDATAVKSAQQRSERLIQALGLFNGRKDSLRDWWQQQEDLRLENTGRHAQKYTTVESRQARIDEEFGTHEQLPTRLRHPISTRANAVASSERDAGQVATQDFDDRATGSVAAQPEFVGENNPLAADAEPLHRVNSASSTADSTVSETPQPEFVLAQAIERTYARATNLIREALGVDGVVCVDASAVTTDTRRNETIIREDGRHRSITSETSGSESAGAAGRPQFVKLQGFSTNLKSSISGSKPSSHAFKLAETALNQLVRRYPKGHIFNFGEDGGLNSSSGGEGTASTGSAESASRPSKTRWKEAQKLGQVMVGSRSIAFHPLWDDTHERWRSCIFVWSTADMRYFDETDNTTHLSTWGHSLMAELSRLETLAADKAKGTFISSVSHELRSPLHGMLAGVEFLQDSTGLTPFQQEMTHTINAAGRTLLDTINHILDHSKISNFTRQQRKDRDDEDTSRHDAGLSANPNEIGTTAQVDLAKLTEETVESIVSAHRYHAMSTRQNAPSGTPPVEHKQRVQAWRSDHTSQDLSITLSIAWRQNWLVKIQPGSWVRILTNLVGNALKYTPRGNIVIDLKAGLGRESSPASLVVRDTGIGISRHFLANDLYTAFKQEDSHSTGTGLGLSIVKQIVKDMGGRIDITSARGEGTKAVVRFEALFVIEESPSGLPMEDSFGKVARNLNIHGFHLLTPASAGGQVIDKGSKELSRSSAAVGRSILDTAAAWLHCKTSIGATVPGEPDLTIYAIMDDELLKWCTAESDSLPVLTELAQKDSKVLVLSRSLHARRVWNTESMRGLQPLVLHQPLGPRKLIRAIASGADPNESLDSGPLSASTSSWKTPSADLSQWNGFPWHTAAAAHPSGTQTSITPSTSPGEKTTPAGPKRPTLRPSQTRRFTTRSYMSDNASISSITQPQTPALGEQTNNADDVVLLVEDNDVNMKLLMALMRKLRRPYQCAVNGREAVDAYRRSPLTFFLILMDISMPVMDGFTATTKIRETEKKLRMPRTKIVALTGVTSADAKQRAFDCGVDEYFAKPVRMQELRELLQRVDADADT